jgi:putative transposase
MVGHPADYPWSSYQFNGQGIANALLSQHPFYRALGQSNEERCRAYRELFQAHPEPELTDKIRQATNGNYAPGDSRFSAAVEAMLQRRVTPGKAGRPVKD